MIARKIKWKKVKIIFTIDDIIQNYENRISCKLNVKSVRHSESGESIEKNHENLRKSVECQTDFPTEPIFLLNAPGRMKSQRRTIEYLRNRLLMKQNKIKPVAIIKPTKFNPFKKKEK